MTDRRASHRYPRRGERIAPETLREFLAEPVPAALLANAADGSLAGLKLCDLDERTWSRFPDEAIEELARLVVEQVAGYHVRKIFQHRHFPLPAQGIRLEDLRLENRTRRCLVREGFDEDLALLGDRTIGQIMSMRAFGPRCLVDLLSALEGARRRTAGSGGSEPAVGLDSQLTAAAGRLARLPEARLALREDPRFGPMIAAIDADARTAADMAARLAAREHDPPDAAYVAEWVRRLHARIEALPRLTVEQELVEIFGATPYRRNRDILVSYYGWNDGRPHTLTEIGVRFGVTRERIRQVCAKLIKKRKQLPVIVAPVMERVLDLVRRRLPCPAAAIEEELRREGLTAVGMRLEGVATAAALLDRPPAFRLVKVDGGRRRDTRLAVRPEEAEAVPAIVDTAGKELYFHGLATVDKVAELAAAKYPAVGSGLVRQALELLDGFAWLDAERGWFRLLKISKHGLPNTIEKILAVAGEVTVGQMRAAIGRNRRLWKEPPPENVLVEFCRGMPRVRIEGDRIISDPPRDWRKVLTGVEARLVGALKQHGGVMERGQLEDVCVAGGMNRFSFHAFVSWSPVIAQYGHSVYGLLGADVDRGEVDALIARRRARRPSRRVLDGHGRTDDGKVWLSYRLSKAASTYAVITIPAALKKVVRGRFRLLDSAGREIGSLATKDGRAWGLGAFLRRQGARVDDRIVLTLDLGRRTATVAWDDRPARKAKGEGPEN